MRLLSIFIFQVVVLVLAESAGFRPEVAWAADPVDSSATVFGTGLSRDHWDLALRWLNFIVLVGLIFKYAKTPVINFLRGQKAETARTIQKVEEKKRLAEEKIREGEIKLEASGQRLTLIKDRIVAEGKRRREQMISEAHNESRMMLAAAKTRVQSQIREAHQTIRSELIDAAFEKAMVKLPRAVTETDHERMLTLWEKEVDRL